MLGKKILTHIYTDAARRPIFSMDITTYITPINNINEDNTNAISIQETKKVFIFLIESDPS